MATLSFRHLDKIYPNNVQAVFDFNLEIKDKEFVVFVGPSGCGKSTTLRMVAGLETISRGELYINNRLVNDVDPTDRDIAMVFQNYALYPHMTVYNNIAFALKMRKHPIKVIATERMLKSQIRALKKAKDCDHSKSIADLENQIKELKAGKKVYTNKMVKYTKKEIDEKVKSAAKILDLEPYLERKPKALSGGQRQRVALGRSIVRNPKVFLMDEPLSNLDAKLRVQTRTEIIKIHERLEATTIYVTHDQTEAMTMADRIVIMKLGFVQQIGAPKEVYRNPINIFVAGFIGSPSMNFFDGVFDGKNFVFDGKSKHSVPLNKEQVKLLKNFKNRKIVMGIRPEDIYVSSDKAAKNKSKPITLTCDLSELLGHLLAVHTRIDDQKLILTTGAEQPIKAGSKNTYVYDEEHIHFFDKETGNCIDYTDEKGAHPFTEIKNLKKNPADSIKIVSKEDEKKAKKKEMIGKVKSIFKKKKSEKSVKEEKKKE